MNWKGMSNFEINKAVLKILIPYEDICEIEQIGHGESVSWGDGYNWYNYNPCNSWTDAGPIIERERITITSALRRDWWDAIDISANIEVRHENPLRAAMIVFLMMQESV